MRVLSVIESLLHGGAETVLVDTVTGLRRHEHVVVHATRSHGAETDPWITGRLEAAAVPCHDMHWSRLQDPGERHDALGGFRPDVVLHHWWGHSAFRPWPRRLDGGLQSRPAFVCVMHNMRYLAPPGYDAYVLVTSEQRPLLGDLDPARVHVIPNGVDLSRFTEPPPHAPERPFTVGRLSNLRPIKIPADWVRTAAGYGLRDTRFVIAGDGALRAALAADVQALGLDSVFSLPGYVVRDDVPRLLSTFDVFCYVAATAVECHPLTLLEAAAAGLPIVSEARGGIPGIVTHGVTGFLAHHPEEIGPFLHTLQRDVALRRRMGLAARQAADRFSLDRQLAAYDVLIETMARAPVTPASPS